MLQVVVPADAKGDPAGVRDPAVFLGQTFGQQRVVDRAGKRNIDDVAGVHVPDFRAAEAELAAAEAMRMNRDVRPGGKLVFQRFQVLHGSTPKYFDDSATTADSAASISRSFALATLVLGSRENYLAADPGLKPRAILSRPLCGLAPLEDIGIFVSRPRVTQNLYG